MTKGEQSIAFEQSPFLMGSASVVGQKEGEGPLGKKFDIVKILQPIPNTCPSFLYSIAGAATELANPVIGTSVPAPHHFASFG